MSAPPTQPNALSNDLLAGLDQFFGLHPGFRAVHAKGVFCSGVFTPTITVNNVADQNDPELRKIIFDPRPGVDGLEATSDPLFEVRAAIYILSGRRRRAATTAK